MPKKIILAALALLATACSTGMPDPTAASSENEAVSSVISVLDGAPALPATRAEIAQADLHGRIEALASDFFEGRAPGTERGEASADWIAADMARIGLEPGADGDWFQSVEMVATTVDLEQSSLTLNINGTPRELIAGQDTVFWTKRQTTDPTDFADSELVFVGYGIVAPEYGWNDYSDVDVTGKTVVMLINDPGFATRDPDLFKGKAMTYYGRWTYKFEEAARQGATAAIIIHDTAPAAYGWNVVSGSWSGEQADLVRKNDGMDRVPMEAWIQLDLGKELFSAAGLDFDLLSKAAQGRSFKAVEMSGITASGQIAQTVKRAESRNVAGMITGSEAPDEYVLYVAHWDHLGKKLNFASGGDNIHNGAVDNATGTSMLLEMAEAYANNETPKRSVLFLAVTLEESGLLGSAYFAENPFVPLNKIVAGLNMDGMLPMGRAKNMIVVGSGASELEDILAELLIAQDRVPTPDPVPQNGYFYRSDHISLAKKGVPMLYADGGEDLRDGGIEAGRAVAAAYTAKDYHKPSDEYDRSWDLSGFVEDGVIFYQLGRQIADSDAWPTWYEGNEFKAIREESLASAE